MKHLVFCDIKVTQGGKKNKDFKPEVIQISALRVSKDFQESSSFSRCVKPEENPYITESLLAKVGVSQYLINSSDTLETVLKQFENWVNEVDEVAFVVWGKEGVYTLTNEIRRKRLKDAFSLTKYFNFQSYLQTKLGMNIGIKSLLHTFGETPEVLRFNTLADVTNMKTLYEKTISQGEDVNKLWFDGKLEQIIRQLKDIIDQNEVKVGKENLIKMKNRCEVYLDISSTLTPQERETLLEEVRLDVQTLSSEIDQDIMVEFRKESIHIQKSLMKSSISGVVLNTEEIEKFIKEWNNISQKYRPFALKKKGNYSLYFAGMRDLHKRINERIVHVHGLSILNQ